MQKTRNSIKIRTLKVSLELEGFIAVSSVKIIINCLFKSLYKASHRPEIIYNQSFFQQVEQKKGLSLDNVYLLAALEPARSLIFSFFFFEY